MVFWILVAIMTAAVAALLLYPLLRGAKAADNERAGEAAVYRDQLRELDRDLAGGLITSDEAEYARAEIGRRLIAVSAAEPGRNARRRGIIASARPSFSCCCRSSDSVFTSRWADRICPRSRWRRGLQNPGNDMAILVAKAERHLAENPDDGKGWDVLAPIYFNTMRIADAENAYRNAIRLLGPSPIRLDGLAETLMAGANGVVTEDARKVLEQSLTLEPENPRAKFYVALSMEQAGQVADAKAAFEALAKESPADAPVAAARQRAHRQERRRSGGGK